MSDTGFTRAGSGVWRVHATPRPQPSPPRGLPHEPKARARYMFEAAMKDITADRLGAAENNLRLALTWDEHNHEYKIMLDHVCQVRRELRSTVQQTAAPLAQRAVAGGRGPA